jgi:hypothetical protein
MEQEELLITLVPALLTFYGILPPYFATVPLVTPSTLIKHVYVTQLIVSSSTVFALIAL